MRFRNLDELKAFCPIENNAWNAEALQEYMIQSCNRDFAEFIDDFMAKYKNDEALAEILFDFLLNEDYDGSDCQIGAAVYIARMDKELLKRKKELLLQAQKNEVCWKRPFQEDVSLDWL